MLHAVIAEHLEVFLREAASRTDGLGLPRFGLSGACDKAWFGWPCSAELEKLRSDWLKAADPAERRKIAEQVQLLAYDEVPYLPWGQYLAPSVYRRQVKGVLNFPAAVLWNVWLDA